MLCRVSHAETLLLGLLLVLMVDLHGVGHYVAYFPAAVHVRIVIELAHRLSDPGAEDRSSGQGSVEQRLQPNGGKTCRGRELKSQTCERRHQSRVHANSALPLVAAERLS